MGETVRGPEPLLFYGADTHGQHSAWDGMGLEGIGVGWRSLEQE